MPSKDYRGRPETIESVFYMWRLTGEQEWQVSYCILAQTLLIRDQDKGWSMFHALVDATIVEGGFAAVSDVTVAPPPLVDSCESFFYAETCAPIVASEREANVLIQFKILLPALCRS